jgi:hypothetical protein
MGGDPIHYLDSNVVSRSAVFCERPLEPGVRPYLGQAGRFVNNFVDRLGSARVVGRTRGNDHNAHEQSQRIHYAEQFPARDVLACIKPPGQGSDG